MMILKWLNKLKVPKKKITIYVFRITREYSERSKFFGSIGNLKNVWFCNADMCWRCVREIKNTYAFNLKWMTPGDNGWESAIKSNPKPSFGTITYWRNKGISQREYKELEENGDVSIIKTHNIFIRKK